ncbi:hypothetical protein HZB60_09395 [candidate division KSB1 bacterium]|nr:hypothetical protein [candidate division KSB1 bacterium]
MDADQKLKTFVNEVDRVLLLEHVANQAYQKQQLKFSAKNGESGFTVNIEAHLPPVDAIRSFMMGFRKFYMNDEPTNFYGICNLVQHGAFSDELKEATRLIRSHYKSGLSGRHFPIQLGPGHVSIEYLIDLYFNGEMFHSDAAKAKVLESIKGSPSEPLFWYFFVVGCSYLFAMISNLAVGLRNADKPEYLRELAECLRIPPANPTP